MCCRSKSSVSSVGFCAFRSYIVQCCFTSLPTSTVAPLQSLACGSKSGSCVSYCVGIVLITNYNGVDYRLCSAYCHETLLVHMLSGSILPVYLCHPLPTFKHHPLCMLQSAVTLMIMPRFKVKDRIGRECFLCCTTCLE